MAENVPLEIVRAEPEPPASSQNATDAFAEIQKKAAELKATLHWLPGIPSSSVFADRARALRESVTPILASASATPKVPISDDYRWLSDHVRLLHSEVRALPSAKARKLPHVRARNGEIVPRVVRIAEAYLEAVSYQLTEPSFLAFIEAIQTESALNLYELWALVPALKLILLERIAHIAPALIASPSCDLSEVGAIVRSLLSISHGAWKTLLEPLIVFDRILREDPSGTYPRMEFDSRELYRIRLAKMAATSEASEVEVARAAVAFARQAQQTHYDDPRVALRESHVGFYLIDRGTKLLQQKIGFRHTPGSKVQSWMRDHADEFFFPGIELLTFLIFSVTALLLTPPSFSPVLLLISFLVLLLPCSQSAVQLMNYFVTSVLTPSSCPSLISSMAFRTTASPWLPSPPCS